MARQERRRHRSARDDSEWWESAPKWVQVWLERFWVVRGALTAISLLTMLPAIVPLSRWELLRGFQAVVLAVRAVLEQVATWVADQVPILSSISGAWVAGLLFAISIGGPAAVASGQVSLSTVFSRGSARIGRAARRIGLAPLMLRRPSWFAAIGIMLALIIAGFILSAWVGFALYRAAGGDALYTGSLWQWVVLAFCGYYLLLSGATTAHAFPGYFRGLVFAVGFLVTLQLAYWANLPVVRAWVIEQIDARVES